jgi:hypothetical protein
VAGGDLDAVQSPRDVEQVDQSMLPGPIRAGELIDQRRYPEPVNFEDARTVTNGAQRCACREPRPHWSSQ